MWFMIVSAAFFRVALDDLDATVSEYTMACGWCFPTSLRSRSMFRRMFALGVWIRAMIYYTVRPMYR